MYFCLYIFSINVDKLYHDRLFFVKNKFTKEVKHRGHFDTEYYVVGNFLDNNDTYTFNIGYYTYTDYTINKTYLQREYSITYMFTGLVIFILFMVAYFLSNHLYIKKYGK